MLSAEILSAAKKLTDLMKADNTYIAVMNAADKYNSDPEISSAMTEYSVQQQALSQEYAKETRDEELCEAIQARINELYNKIVSTAAYEEYKAASDEYQAFYSQVYDELNYQLTGKRAGACSGDCSSCGGCH